MHNVPYYQRIWHKRWVSGLRLSTMTDKLNILVLHSLGDPRRAPLFLKHHVFSMRDCCPDHNYIYHDSSLPIPEYVKDARFDAILLDVTFLWARWFPTETYKTLLKDYSFVKSSDAVKIAFPQDEYDCNEILDEWMCDWGVDNVVSVLSSGWDVLYPKYSKTGSITLGYTGYIDETLENRASKPFAKRTIEIGYRARKLPPYFGRLGETKWQIGQAVSIACAERGVRANIVLGEQGVLNGEAWLDFIDDCKFTLGANSGSSLLDSTGRIQQNVRAYLAEFPDASFEEVEQACFKGLDGHHSFTAISPRVLEAGLLESCQILVDGHYSGIVQPWEHYIPIRSDASNFDEVYKAMQDKNMVEAMRKRCKQALLDVDELRYVNRAQKIIELIKDLASSKGVVSDSDLVSKVKVRYIEETVKKYAVLWQKEWVSRQVASINEVSPTLSRVLGRAASYWFLFSQRNSD